MADLDDRVPIDITVSRLQAIIVEAALELNITEAVQTKVYDLMGGTLVTDDEVENAQEALSEEWGMF